MKRTVCLFFAFFAVTSVAFWLAGSVVAWDFNPANWPVLGRGFAACVSLFAASAITVEAA